MQQITGRQCMLPDAVLPRRSPFERLPFCSPVGPYLDINKTTSIPWDSQLSPFPASCPALYNCSTLYHGVPPGATHVSHSYSPFNSQFPIPSHMSTAACSSVPLYRPESLTAPEAPSCSPPQPVANSRSPTNTSPTTVRHNGFESRKSSPHPVTIGVSDSVSGKTERPSAEPIHMEDRNLSLRMASTSISPYSRIVENEIQPPPLPGVLARRHSPGLSFAQSGSASIDVASHGRSVDQSRRSATSLRTANDARDAHQLKVMVNSLSIRRSRRARRPTVRSVTPSPPRNESTERTPWLKRQ